MFIPNLQVWAQLNAPNPGTPFLHEKNVRTGNLENPTAQCVQPPPPPGARRVPFPIGHAGVYLRYIVIYQDVCGPCQFQHTSATLFGDSHEPESGLKAPATKTIEQH